MKSAIQTIIQFGVRFDLLDQTILQAITFFECYMARNSNIIPTFLKEIAIIAVEIAIKNNEDKVLSLKECVYMIDKIGTSAEPDTNIESEKKDKFNVKMFGALELHMLQLLHFNINVPTALDFLLFITHKLFPQNDAQTLVRLSLPWVYFVSINYELGRGKKSSAIALAALLHTV